MMRNSGSGEQSGSGLTAQALTWGGVLLLLIGSLLAYPYVRSRLAVLSSAPVSTPTPVQSVIVPSPTATYIVPTSTPTTTPIPTSTQPPTPSPPPALPTRIIIPAIGVDAPVVPVSWKMSEIDDQTHAAWEVPDMDAAGWHETSAPLGVPGNTVLNGHNTTNGEVFRDLYTLEAGEIVTVYADDVAFTYTVSETLILPEAGQPLEVRLENARYILPTEDERLTLVTCHPYGSLRYRLIVIALPSAGSP